MTPDEKRRALKYLDEVEAKLLQQLELAMSSDPFWWYQPSTGEVTDERRKFLDKHLKPEDVPAALVGQKHFHLSTSPIRGASGGNQSGKTLACCIEGLIFATGQVPQTMRDWYPAEKLPPPELKVRMIRVVGENWEDGILKNVLPTWQRWVPRQWLKDGDWKKSYSAEQATLTLYDPQTRQPCAYVDFMANTQEIGAFQGPPRHMLIYDEEPRWDVYKENLARFTTAPRINIVFGMTPTRGISWVKQELVDKFQDDAGRSVDWFKLSSVTNLRANLGTLDLMLAQLPYDEKKMRLLGEFVSLSGLVYGGVWARTTHLIQRFPFWCTCAGEGWRTGVHPPECPWNHFIVYRGLDPHLVTNTACVWVAVDREDNHYVGYGYFDDADTEQVKRDIWERSAKMRLGFAVCDSAADSDIKAFSDRNVFKELKAGPFGIRRLRLASKGPNSIKPGVDQIKERLRTGKLFVFDIPELRPLHAAFETMERDRGIQEEKKGPRDRILEAKFHQHAALRYVEKYKLPWRSPQDQYAGVAVGSGEEDLEGNI
jgi:phage terminase large subunit-like protein